MIRTRFAPSPTGYLHLGGARTALFSWAYARRHGGRFLLRIEDTDTERSTAASTQAILDAMTWLGLDYDEGPFFQMQRLDRYRAVVEQLLASGHAYPCYASKEELDSLREQQRARGEKPRYDGRWRPENAKGKVPPPGVKPVIRFRNPDDGVVEWDDLVKGPIRFANAELDDLVILRADGVPTYNLGVVVDDWDMDCNHVLRGDDHVNNTPRQINIFRALGAELPRFGHIPMILGADGERLSKRHGAVSVMQYPEDGYLPEALNNYLARLGWSHGDAEIFSLAQLRDWFDLAHVNRSPAQFDPVKLLWLNAHWLKQASDDRLAQLVAPRLAAVGFDTARGPALDTVVALYKERSETVVHLTEAVGIFYHRPPVPQALRDAQYSRESTVPLNALASRLQSVAWTAADIGATIKAVAAEHGVKMPKVAMPLRAMLTGQAQSPAIDAICALLGRDETLARIDAERPHWPQ
ncbi:MAG: glutamate--tRNA ligase [Burkholderiales bacterium]|jgi:glutamyl-tRNA synthetase|nr:glutamate--tRNA ligase [Burkholderiales bacterium]